MTLVFLGRCSRSGVRMSQRTWFAWRRTSTASDCTTSTESAESCERATMVGIRHRTGLGQQGLGQ